MITAAIHGVPVQPTAPEDREGDLFLDLSRIASEVCERIEEMSEIKVGAGAKFIQRLATLARMDEGAFELVIALFHGKSGVLTDSYSARAGATGRKKQTIHYRTMTQIDTIAAVFPELGSRLEEIRNSVKHHEDPIAKGQVLRDADE